METGLVKNTLKVVAIALALPSTILGVFFLIYYLINKNIISQNLGLGFLVLIIAYFFYLMVRYATSKK